MDESIVDTLDVGPEPPKWLQTAIDAAKTSPDFEAKLAETGRVSHSLALLRKERGKMSGFAGPVSLRGLVQFLATRASIDPEFVFRYLSLNLEAVDELSPVALVRLCRAIGLSLREALIHVRIGFVGDGAVFAETLQRGNPESMLSRCESELSRIEAGYDDKTLLRIRALEREIDSGYRQTD
jgi:hypothetical protein